MTAITFDTLAYSKKLKKAGVPEKQAEAQAEIMAETMTEILSNNLATKHDLRTEIGKLRSDLKQDMANLTIKVGAMMAGSVTLMLTLLPIILKLMNLI